MPLDAIAIHALAEELNTALPGARIDKIQQPERDVIILSVRGGFGNKKLLINAGSGTARVHFTSAAMENPAEPPMFCMLLRKHLTGARIVSISQPEHERLLMLSLETRDEMNDLAPKTLVLEMMGRSSNLILNGPDGRIIDCLRRMDFAGDELRKLQPGMFYRLPPKQNKTCFFDTESSQRAAMIAAADDSIPVERWLLDSFSGLSPLICRELSFRCSGSFARLGTELDALAEKISVGKLVPTMLLEDGRPRDYSFRTILQYGPSVENVEYPDYSSLLDAFYAQKDREESRRRRSHELLRSIRTIRDRVQRKLAAQREEYKRTGNRDEIRKNAELLTANLYRTKKGDHELVCEDYYREGCPEIRIPLDPLKTPQQNAARWFKEYSKLKTAEEHLSVLIAQGEAQLDYLNSVLDEIERAESEKDLSDLRRELTETGVLKKQKKQKSEKNRPQQPCVYRSDDGFEILVGRSNLQNDELTFKIARRTDLWLHTQKIHGSHVVIRCEGEQPPDRTIEQAASLAVWHSQGRTGGKTAVDCTQIRFVKKPSGALPGKVIYTDAQTILAQADEALAERLRIKK